MHLVVILPRGTNQMMPLVKSVIIQRPYHIFIPEYIFETRLTNQLGELNEELFHVQNFSL